MFRMTASDTRSWLATTDPILVVALDDAVVEALGYDPDSVYAETTGSR